MDAQDGVIKSETLCVYATNTGRKWARCPWVACTEIECRNAARNERLNKKTDGASFHSRYPEGVARDVAPFVLVRSSFCCQKHCVDYAKSYFEGRANIF